MSNPTEGVKDILVTAGVGVFLASSGWGIYIGKMPDDPDTTVTVYLAGGGNPHPALTLDFPDTQVIVRGPKGGYQAAYTKAVEVKDALLGLPSQTVNSDEWWSVRQRGDIAPMGFDESNRPKFSLNFMHIIEPASGTYRSWPPSGP